MGSTYPTHLNRGVWGGGGVFVREEIDGMDGNGATTLSHAGQRGTVYVLKQKRRYTFQSSSIFGTPLPFN